MISLYNSYYENGIVVIPNVIAEGDKATILYKGLLYNSGAHSVFMHFGHGNNWNDTTDVRMEKTDEGFKAVVPVVSPDKLNVVFKDCANNWDNNSGSNYTFEVESRS